MPEVEWGVMLLLLMLVERTCALAVRLQTDFLQPVEILASGEGLGGSEGQRDAHIGLV